MHTIYRYMYLKGVRTNSDALNVQIETKEITKEENETNNGIFQVQLRATVCLVTIP